MGTLEGLLRPYVVFRKVVAGTCCDLQARLLSKKGAFAGLTGSVSKRASGCGGEGLG